MDTLTRSEKIALAPRLVTKRHLAERYAVSPRTITSWLRTRRLPHYRLNARCLRFDVDACDRALDGFIIQARKDGAA